MRSLVIFGLSIACLAALPRPGRAQDPGELAVFSIGRGGQAAKAAVDVQHQLRQQADKAGSIRLVDLAARLDPGGESPRLRAIEEGRALLEAGKQAYEQLELETALAKFNAALKKFEYGFGYLDKPGYLVETLMFLGASNVLMGEPEQAKVYFARAADLPGRKTLREELFPPNIQEIFEQTRTEVQTAPRARVSLSTVPQGAALFIDDVYRGGSPLQLDDLRPGEHLVRALKDGYRPWGGKIRVDAKRSRRLKLTLKPSARRKQFSKLFRKMAAEMVKGQPGPATEGLAGFLGAGRLLTVVLEGEPTAMTLQGFACFVDGQVRFLQIKDVLDTTSPGYSQRLEEFLNKLLRAKPGDEFAETETEGAEGYDAGAADAARMLAESQGAGTGGGEGMGLDLGEGGGSTAPPAGSGQQEAAATDSDLQNEERAEQTARAGQTGQAEQTGQTEQAERVVQDAARSDGDRDSAPGFAFSWGYLHDKWWFWTAVGVVVAGAATGTYFAVAGAGGDSGGELVLGLH